MGTIGIVPPDGNVVDGIFGGAPDEDYAAKFRYLRLLLSCQGPPSPTTVELRAALEAVAKAERDQADLPDYSSDPLPTVILEYLDLAAWIDDHRQAGFECEWLKYCDEMEREIPALVANLIPWITDAPLETTAEQVMEPPPEDAPLTDEDRAGLRKTITEARAGNPTLARRWIGFSGTRPADLPDGEREAALDALLALARHLEDGMGLTRQEVNFAIEVRCAEARGVDNMTTPPMPLFQQGPAANDQPTPIDWNPLKKLQTALEAAEKAIDAEVFYASLSLTSFLTPGKYDNLVGCIKLANVRGAKSGFHISVNKVHEFRRQRHAAAEKTNNLDRKAGEVKATGKLAIVIAGKQLSELRAEAISALQKANQPEPTLFRRVRNLTRYREAAGQPYLEPQDWLGTRSMLTDAALFYQDESYKPAFPPRALAEDILACELPPGTFPEVEAITHIPIIHTDGTITVTGGYDPVSRMIYCPPPGCVLPPMPPNPTADQLSEAARKLRHVTVDFPFQSKADHDNFWGYVLTPLLRHMVDVVPLNALDSPAQGSGKGLLVSVASILATGQVAVTTNAPVTREEWAKKILALLDGGTTFVVFDNLRGTLESDALEAVLTSPLYSGRILGRTEERIVPNKATWACTGNNVVLSRDLIRRAYRTRIDPRCSQPYLRKKFEHPDLIGYVKAERANLLAALFTMIRAWFNAGKPGFGGVAFGSYTAWKDMTGGILRNAGFHDFLGNQRELYSEMDLESEEWETFLLNIKERRDTREFSVAELVNLIHEGFVGNLPKDIAKVYGVSTTHEKSKPNPFFAVQVGHILRSRRGTRFGTSEVYIERSSHDLHNKIALYRIGHGNGA